MAMAMPTARAKTGEHEEVRRGARDFRVGFLRASAPLDAERSGVVTLGEPEAQARVLHIGGAQSPG